ncbi:MAG TPA: hypothetical protein VMA54_15705 [Steroidobacteraceae bacterium]|nr:hypothetical protein [Steroidobacteraceae bacterium]
MTKLSKAVSAALMAVVAVGASAGAFAATNPTQGPTDLFVAVWNTTTDASYVEDLGSIGAGTYSQLGTTFDTAGYTTSWNVDGGDLSTLLGSGTYQYQVFAGSDVSGSTYKNNSGYLSLAAGDAIPTTMTNTWLVNNSIGAAGSITAYLESFLPGSTTSYAGTTTGPGGDSWLASNTSSPGFDFQNPALTNQSSATVGSALNLVYYLATTNQAAGTPSTAGVGADGGLGTFLLSADGLLTYNAGGASPVPLPPAGWLLISGLLGLLAVSRRRGAAAS